MSLLPRDLPSGGREREGRRRYARALRMGFVLSAFLHLLVLVLTRVQVPVNTYPRPIVDSTPAPDELIVVDVVPVDEPEERAPDDPRPEPSPERPPPDRQRQPDVELVPIPEAAAPPPEQPRPPARPVEPEEDPDRTNAERLTPRFVDARLWIDPSAPGLVGERLRRFARADSAVRAILREWLDSVALIEEQERRARDWTFEKDGKRYGISSEGLHLGDITIPIPFTLTPSGPQRREFEQALKDLREIQAQDLRADLDKVRDERREAMRERARGEGGRRGADTTGVRIGESATRGGRRPDRAVPDRSFPSREHTIKLSGPPLAGTRGG